MKKCLLKIAVLLVGVNVVVSTINSTPLFKEKFCRGNNDIESYFEPALVDGYNVKINQKLPAETELRVQLDSEGTITFLDSTYDWPQYKASFSSEMDRINNIVTFDLLADYDDFTFRVKDNPRPFQPPYIISLKINGDEQCEDPDREYFNRYPLSVSKLWSPGYDKQCGRRRTAKDSDSGLSGDWPWITLIYRLDEDGTRYNICGGTLISKTTVLTAAHCVSSYGETTNPEALGVVLGNANEITSQDVKVYKIDVLDGFDPASLRSDLALLKLSTEVVYNNYVQPVCLWSDEIYEHLQSSDVKGTVVGKGIGQGQGTDDYIDYQVMSVRLDSNPECVIEKPIFSDDVNSGKIFCAEHINGTACMEDNGGSLVLFVEDSKEDMLYREDVPGAWYLKGIATTIIEKNYDICHPDAYAIYTDVGKHRNWILANME